MTIAGMVSSMCRNLDSLLSAHPFLIMSCPICYNKVNFLKKKLARLEETPLGAPRISRTIALGAAKFFLDSEAMLIVGSSLYLSFTVTLWQRMTQLPDSLSRHQNRSPRLHEFLTISCSVKTSMLLSASLTHLDSGIPALEWLLAHRVASRLCKTSNCKL